MANELHNKIKQKSKKHSSDYAKCGVFPVLFQTDFHSAQSKRYGTIFGSWLENKRRTFLCSQNHLWSYPFFFFLGVSWFVFSPRIWKTCFHFSYSLRAYLNLYVTLLTWTTKLKASLKLGILHNHCFTFIYINSLEQQPRLKRLARQVGILTGGIESQIKSRVFSFYWCFLSIVEQLYP